ncbi:MAG: Desulfoferrodoxin [Candidatus Peregrinibacteria bacterium GW2011_GWA2_43_8]|nr:MAG: Desulfoferrodoxin [Candidatus Peregrinibacteria bacterium GW2011_GWA2_43_8]
MPDSWVCPVCGAPKSEFERVHHLGEEFTGGEAQEKHVPVIEADGDFLKVKIGAVPHPMLETHYIMTVVLYKNGGVFKKVSLKPGTDPVAVFDGVKFDSSLEAVEHCNLHGYWINA